MAQFLDSVPFSGIIRIRDMMYSVDRPFRLDQGDVSFDAPESVKEALRKGIAENRTHYVQTTGIPPLLGFWGKLVVFQSAVQAGMFPVAVLGVLGSVVGAFYYLKVVKVMYFDEPAGKALGKSDWVHQAILALCVLFLSPLGYLVVKCLTALADLAVAALLTAA